LIRGAGVEIARWNYNNTLYRLAMLFLNVRYNDGIEPRRNSALRILIAHYFFDVPYTHLLRSRYIGTNEYHRFLETSSPFAELVCLPEPSVLQA
jgi:hypothetical protein